MKDIFKTFKGILAILLLAQSFFVSGQGATCATADPFCTATGFSFLNNTGIPDASVTDPGNNYGCLTTQPNPAWFYMEVDNGGNIIFDISQQSAAGSGLDVDFILYGPYSDYASATGACGQLGTATTAVDPDQIVDCSFSTAAQETATINGANPGDVYMILLTNYSNEAGTINFNQTGGSGSSDCSIVTPTCPTVGFHAEVGVNSYSLPLSLDCDAVGWLTLKENDVATAGGSLTPSILVDISPANGNATGNNIYGYENNVAGPPGWNNWWSSINIPANSNYTFTMLEVDNGPNTTAIGVEVCDVLSGTNMSYTITDGACGAVISTGTWTAGGGSAGPNGSPSSGGCQFITIPVASVSGSATYSCPTCPAGSFVTTDFGQASFSPSIAGPGSYDVEYCWDNECVAPADCQSCVTETITVTNPFTVTSLSYSSPVCSSGSNISPVLTGTSGGVYSSTAGLSINSSTGIINPGASTSGTYTITYFIGTALPSGCNASTTTSVTITDVPTVSSAGSDQTICGTTATLAGNAAVTGSGIWTLISGSGTITTPSSPTSGITGLGSGANIFQWSITNAPCPASNDNITITVASVVSAGADNTDTLCSNGGNTIDLNTLLLGNTGVGTWSETTATVSGQFNSVTGLFDVGSLTAGNYTFTYVVAGNPPCLDDTADFTITVNPLPIALDQNPQLCEDVSGGASVAGVDLTALNSAINGVSGNTLSWFTDQSLSTPVGMPTNVTVNNLDAFYVLVYNGSCYDTAIVTYTVVGTIVLTNLSDSLCEDVFGGGSVANVNLTSYNNTVFTNSGSTVYNWFANSALTIPVGVPTNLTVVTNDTFYVDVIDGSCNNSAMVTFIVNSQSVGTLDSTICNGESFVFNGTTYDGGNLGGAEVLSAANGCDSVVTVTVNELLAITSDLDSAMCTGGSFVFNGTTYDASNLTGTEVLVAASGCDSVVIVTLVISPQLSITAMNDDTICSGSNVLLTAVASGSGTVEWYSDAAGTVLLGTGVPLVLVNPGNGVYTYYVAEVGSACPSNIDSVVITVDGVVAVINATPLTGAVPLNVTLDANNSVGAIIGYQWDFGNGGMGSQISELTMYTELGSYTVELIVTNGVCSDTASIVIDAFGESVILIPNVFTPNGDGQNDVFTIEGVNLESVEGEIFNRWGQKMFSWSNVKGYWDGRTLAGEEAPDGTYFYMIKAIGVDGEEYLKKGGVSLVR